MGWLPFADHTNEYSEKRNEEASMFACQSDGSTLDLAMTPVGPEAQVDIIVNNLGGRHDSQ